MTMRNRFNIILIILDTFREDYFRYYINKFKDNEFFFYKNTISPSPWTPPSHGSIFTGVYPFIHGTHIYNDKNWMNYKIKPASKALFFTRILKNLGYRTYLLSANPYISPIFGYTDFDNIINIDPYFKMIYRLNWIRERKLREIIVKNKFSRLDTIKDIVKSHDVRFLYESALYFLSKRFWKYSFPIKYLYYKIHNWPREKGVSKFINILEKTKFNLHISKFIFLNLMEVHGPYIINDPIYREHIENLKTYRLNQHNLKIWKEKYKEFSLYLIKKLLDLVEILKQKRIFDDSLIIITSDHGQLLGEYNRIGHGIFLYDELLRVPLLIKYPSKIEVKHFETNSESYINLINLKSLILEVIKNESSIINENILYSDTVYSESYGIPNNFINLNNDEKKNINYLDKYRIAIYSKGAKAVFNVHDWQFDKNFCEKNISELDNYHLNIMKRKINMFLKYGLSIKKKVKIR